jgi:hypothetical protein
MRSSTPLDEQAAERWRWGAQVPDHNETQD